MIPGSFGFKGRVLFSAALGLCAAGSTCTVDAGSQSRTATVLGDFPSTAPRLAGIWQIIATDTETRHVAWLVCDETGDPRAIQGIGAPSAALGLDLLSAAVSEDCGVIHGLPPSSGCLHLDGNAHGTAGGGIYAAAATASQENSRINITVSVEVQESIGSVRRVSIGIDGVFAENLEEAEELAKGIENGGFSLAGMVADAARGMMTVSEASAHDPGESTEVVILRLLFY